MKHIIFLLSFLFCFSSDAQQKVVHLTDDNFSAGYLDNSGKLEVSQAFSLGEYLLDFDNLPNRMDAENVGTGTQSYNAVDNSQDLSVTTSGDAAIFESKQYHPYFPGNAQQVEFTFIGFAPETDVTKRIGYFNSNSASPFDSDRDGVLLQSNGGIVTFRVFKQGVNKYIADQSVWDDPLDGTGASGLTIDWNNFQVFLIDFLYLGGTTVNLYWISGGSKHLIHSFHHSNNDNTTIFNSPSKPIRAEIRSTGGAGSFKFVCAQISSMGGDLETSGLPIGLNTGGLITATTSGTTYPLLAIRKNDNSIEHFVQDLSIACQAGNAESYIWSLEINPTLSAGLTYSAISNTGIDSAVGDGVITVTSPGYVVASGVGVSRSDIAINVSKAFRIGQEISGAFDELVLTYTPNTNGQDLTASINSIILK